MKFFSFIGKLFLIILETILLLCLLLYGVMYVLCKGPSPTARDLFVKSVKETSAIGFLADLYLSEAEIDEIMQAKEIIAASSMDTSLVNIDDSQSSSAGNADAWGLIDDDGDGIVIEEVHGATYSGYMMVVYDPKRVIVGCNPGRFGDRGYTVEEMVQRFNAVAGINGGGFEDENGMGDGSSPDTLVVFDYGKYNGGAGTRNSFVGIDGDGILHVDCQTTSEINNANIRWGCAYQQILVSNGKIVVNENKSSGLNPRTAIGQRADGAILMLVIDGRHVVSLGATYYDEAEIMVKYGAVNAGNMDGGSSSLMYYNGEYVNNKAAVIGVRNVPTTWLVLPEGVDYEDIKLQ